MGVPQNCTKQDEDENYLNITVNVLEEYDINDIVTDDAVTIIEEKKKWTDGTIIECNNFPDDASVRSFVITLSDCQSTALRKKKKLKIVGDSQSDANDPSSLGFCVINSESTLGTTSFISLNNLDPRICSQRSSFSSSSFEDPAPKDYEDEGAVVPTKLHNENQMLDLTFEQIYRDTAWRTDSIATRIASYIKGCKNRFVPSWTQAWESTAYRKQFNGNCLGTTLKQMFGDTVVDQASCMCYADTPALAPPQNNHHPTPTTTPPSSTSSKDYGGIGRRLNQNQLYTACACNHFFVTVTGASSPTSYLITAADRTNSTINDAPDPTLRFNKGDIVVFENTEHHHPLMLRTTGINLPFVLNETSGETGHLPPNQEGPFTSVYVFNETGTFEYYCEYHSEMVGTINVVDVAVNVVDVAVNAPESPSPQPQPPLSCLPPRIKVDVANSQYVLKNADDDALIGIDGSGKALVGATRYVFEHVPSNHPMRISATNSNPASGCFPVLLNNVNNDTHCSGNCTWVIPLECANHDLSLDCSAHGAMGGTNRLAFSSTCVNASLGNMPEVRLRHGKLYINDAETYLWGVNWQPHVLGVRGYDISVDTATTEAADDAPKIAAAGFNVIKTYNMWETSAAWIDHMYEQGVYTVTGPIAYGITNDTLRSMVATHGHSPGLLFWVIGNEWNYNKLYYNTSLEQAEQRLLEWCEVLKSADPTRPVLSVWGDPGNYYPHPDNGQASQDRPTRLDECVGGWAFNMYRASFTTTGYVESTSFGNLNYYGDLEDTYRVVGEYGMDAYDSVINEEDEMTQANATKNMMTELYRSRGWSGGFVFAWQDEWWKADFVDQQDNGGWSASPSHIPHYSEDWWGLTRADGTEREALAVYTQTKAELLFPSPPPFPPFSPDRAPQPPPSLPPFSPGRAPQPPPPPSPSPPPPSPPFPPPPPFPSVPPFPPDQAPVPPPPSPPAPPCTCCENGAVNVSACQSMWTWSNPDDQATCSGHYNWAFWDFASPTRGNSADSCDAITYYPQCWGCATSQILSSPPPSSPPIDDCSSTFVRNPKQNLKNDGAGPAGLSTNPLTYINDVSECCTACLLNADCGGFVEVHFNQKNCYFKSIASFDNVGLKPDNHTHTFIRTFPSPPLSPPTSPSRPSPPSSPSPSPLAPCLPSIMESVMSGNDDQGNLRYKIDGIITTAARVGLGWYLFHNSAGHIPKVVATQQLLIGTSGTNDWPYSLAAGYHVLYISDASAVPARLQCHITNHRTMTIDLTYDAECSGAFAPSPPSLPLTAASSLCSFSDPQDKHCGANAQLARYHNSDDVWINIGINPADSAYNGFNDFDRTHAMCCTACMTNTDCAHYALLRDTGDAGDYCILYLNSLNPSICGAAIAFGFGQLRTKIPWPLPPFSPPPPPFSPLPPISPPPPPVPLSPPCSPPPPPTPPEIPPSPGIPLASTLNPDTSLNDCDIPQSTVFYVAEGSTLDFCDGTIHVKGRLEVQSNTQIRTSRIEVEDTGSVVIGSEANPATNVTIYLDHANCEHLMGDRSEDQSDTAKLCLKRGQIMIRGTWHSYGVPKTAWTLLSTSTPTWFNSVATSLQTTIDQTLKWHPAKDWSMAFKLTATTSQAPGIEIFKFEPQDTIVQVGNYVKMTSNPDLSLVDLEFKSKWAIWPEGLLKITVDMSTYSEVDVLLSYNGQGYVAGDASITLPDLATTANGHGLSYYWRGRNSGDTTYSDWNQVTDTAVDSFNANTNTHFYDIGGNWHWKATFSEMITDVQMSLEVKTLETITPLHSIRVEECRGWATDDRIVFAYNGGAGQHSRQLDPDQGTYSVARKITYVEPGPDGRDCLVGYDTPLTCNNCDMGNTLVYTAHPHNFDYSAEILHMTRSITITGPMHWMGTNSFDSVNGGQGIVTRAEGNGDIVMNWHQMTNCGRRMLGAYCHHLHHRFEAGGTFIGVSVEDSVSKGFTIHGTSGALVEMATMFNHRGANIYLENGAEYNNILRANVFTCEKMSPKNGRCALQGNIASQDDADNEEQSGIYSMSMTAAHLIGNRISMINNAFFVNQYKKWGQDIAEHKVAPTVTPMSMFVNNVFHNNHGFGWYANLHAPLDVPIDNQGYVTDWARACPWNFVTGENHAKPGEISNHVEYLNDFSWGCYELADTTCRNCTLTSTFKPVYWKTYSRAKNTPPLLVDTYVEGIHTPNAKAEFPGGQGLVEFKNVTWGKGYENVKVNHHCMEQNSLGGLCASSYWVNGGTHAETLSFQSEIQDSSMIFENSVTNKTYFLASEEAQPTFDLTICTFISDFGNEGTNQDVYECPSIYKIRPLIIYTLHRGTLVVRDGAPGHQSDAVDIKPKTRRLSENTGLGYNYCPSGKNRVNGYTMLVRDGAQLKINIPAGGVTQHHGAGEEDWADQFVMWYSEEQWPEELQSQITVTVEGPGAEQYGLDGGPYDIRSDHPRTYMTPYGAFTSNAGAWWHAKLTNGGDTTTWSSLPGFLDNDAYETQRLALISSKTST